MVIIKIKHWRFKNLQLRKCLSKPCSFKGILAIPGESDMKQHSTCSSEVCNPESAQAIGQIESVLPY